MAQLKTTIDAGNVTFKANKAAMESLVSDLKEKLMAVEQGGGSKSCERHVGRGKLLPRDRINHLLDAGSPFLELSALAAHDVYEDHIPSAGIITGIGRIAGQECMIICNDATVKGGTYYPLTVKKHLRAQEIAEQTSQAAADKARRGARGTARVRLQATDGL